MNYLSPEILCHVISFLEDKEIARLDEVSSQFRRNPLINSVWFKLCLMKWEIDPVEFGVVCKSAYVSAERFKLLYPFASAIPGMLQPTINSEVKLTTKGTKASFSGIVGQGNRSVQAITPFPQVICESYSKTTWLTLVCNSILCKVRTQESVDKKKNKQIVSIPFVDMENTIKFVRSSVVYYEVLFLF